DELTNDEIHGHGEGNLRIISGTSEKMTMRGRFDINDGVYNFSFQSFFKKPFELNKYVNNYIEWTGDPFHPIVNIEAIYKTERKVDFAPLITNNIPNSNISSFRDFVYVVAKMRGDLFKPDITFALDFPTESLAKTDATVSFTIDEILKNENELNKQVAFLVVFNSFAPSNSASSLGLASASGVDLFVNSISDFLSSQINGVLNNILSNKLKIPGLYVNFSGSLYNPNPIGDAFLYDRTNLNLSVGKTIFNNRVVLTFEGNYDVPFQSTASQVSSDLLTNFTTEFLINKSGSIRATIFYRENVDLLTGYSTSAGKSRKYGTSLTYRKDFNRLGDIFRRKKKMAPTPAPLDTPTKQGN
ncbi:MAG TPA: translocation/assembly module TamB domain-containing protein, partial [Chitinophagaceae bacterium]